MSPALLLLGISLLIGSVSIVDPLLHAIAPALASVPSPSAEAHSALCCTSPGSAAIPAAVICWPAPDGADTPNSSFAGDDFANDADGLCKP